MTDEANWVWSESSTLEMTGGVDGEPGKWADWSSIELAGTDFGPEEGFSSNFQLVSLSLGQNARVYLADLIDNGNRFDHGFVSLEALYVKDLYVADGAILNLNGVHLYWQNKTGAGQIINQPVPEPTTMCLLTLGGVALPRCRRR